MMKCDIDVNVVGCNSWQWLEMDGRGWGKWRRYLQQNPHIDTDHRTPDIGKISQHIIFFWFCLAEITHVLHLHVAYIKQALLV
jgi:hypothetical protein